MEMNLNEKENANRLSLLFSSASFNLLSAFGR